MMTCYMIVVYIFYFYLAKLKIDSIIWFPLIVEGIDFTGLVKYKSLGTTNLRWIVNRK